MGKTVREQVEEAMERLASARAYFDDQGCVRSLEAAEDAAIAMLIRNAALFASSAETAQQLEATRAERDALKTLVDRARFALDEALYGDPSAACRRELDATLSALCAASRTSSPIPPHTTAS